MTTLDPIAAEYLRLVAEDDVRVGQARKEPAPIVDMLKVAWAVTRHPLYGGEYYRATRPAALASRDFGWHTAVIEKIGSVEGSIKVAGQAYGAEHVIEPDVWIFRPMGREEEGSNWHLVDIVERIHAAGQLVIADLDDDIWAHEDWSEDREGTDDRFEEWCWKVDGWLVSTPWMKARVEDIARRRGVPEQKVLVAPNCYDPFGLGKDSNPIPGRRMGTRLWLSGRMSGDLDIYRECFAPLLEALDLTWVHIGRETNVVEGPGVHARNFVDDCAMPRHRVLELGACPLPEMGKLLGASMSIGAIAMADHAFNVAKTETHAVELASAGLPLVAATSLEIYEKVPGQVYPNPKSVRQRVKRLLEPEAWAWESNRARDWARKTSVRSEATHMRALQSLVTDLLKR
jgi:hypothetical protein